MPEVKKISLKKRLNTYQFVKCQLINELIFLKQENIIPSDIDLLTLLSIWGPIELGKFCVNATKFIHKNIEPDKFSIRCQSIRNKIQKLEKRNFVLRTDNKKFIILNNNLNIVKESNTIISYNYLLLETNKA